MAKGGGKGGSTLPHDLSLLQAEVLAGLEDDSSDDVEFEKEFAMARSKASFEKPISVAAVRAVLSPVAEETRSPEKRIDKLVELTEVALLSAASEGDFERSERVEDVTQLLFRNRRLKSLTTPGAIDLSRLSGSLEILSLSNNQLTDIQPLSALASLVEVNVNFNKIADLSPLFECELLEKLFASNNKVSSIVGLEACRKLYEVSLYANCLADTVETTETLQQLPELRQLDLGHNPCIASPGQRYKLIQALPKLIVFDNRALGEADKKFASGFFEAQDMKNGCSSAEDCGSANAAAMSPTTSSEPVPKSRPDTAPAACSRPPPMPGRSSGPGGSPLGSAAGSGPRSFGSLPGQKLKSARANRFDELLTQSREPSPDPEAGSRNLTPALHMDGQDPIVTLKILEAHSETLHRRLETLQMERDNLRFQVRLLERDLEEAHPAWLRERVERLELENRSSQSVFSERDQLQSRLAEVEAAFAALDGGHATGAAHSDVVHAEAPPDEDAIEDLKMEGKLLEKRVERSQRYAEKLQQEYLRAQLKSSCMRTAAACEQVSPGVSRAVAVAPDDVGDPEVTALLADNEARLRHLRDEVRDTATAMARKAVGQTARKPQPQQQQQGVDVLRLGEGPADEDTEYHSARR